MASHKQQIKRFWKPDGIAVDPYGEAAIKEWMRPNALSLQAGSITTLLYSPALKSARAAIVAKVIQPAREKSRGKR